MNKSLANVCAPEQLSLRINITFSIAPAKTKISFRYLFLLIQSLYILKGEWISFLTMVPIKNKNKGSGKKIIEHFHSNWNLKSEKVQRREVLAAKIIS